MNRPRRIPEVVQTSSMDCGPAALAAVLGGFGVDVSYPRLREACQTDVDGTSIDTLEDLALRFGLQAEQVVLPADFLLDGRGANLPCIVVVTLPNALTHFVVLWRRLGGWYEVMDPARGRVWMRRSEVEEVLYRHALDVPAEAWLEYARSNDFIEALVAGFAELGIDEGSARRLVQDALARPCWREIAALDAALRLCRALRRTGERLDERAVRTLVELAGADAACVPETFHQVVPSTAADDHLTLRGVVALRFRGIGTLETGADPVVARCLGRDPDRPAPRTSFPRDSFARRLWRVTRELGGARNVNAILGIAGIVGVLTFAEALVFRYLIGLEPPGDPSTFAWVATTALLPSLAALGFEAGLGRFVQSVGRDLELRLRARLLHQLPRIRDDYFASRLLSDLAERGHAVTRLEDLPGVAARIVADSSRVTLVAVGLVWALPGEWPAIVVAYAFAILAPWSMYGLLAERDLRVRTHVGALSAMHLDALRATEPLWSHGGGHAFAFEHEALLVRWARATRSLERPASVFEALQIAALAGAGVWLVLQSFAAALPYGTVLLVAYWGLFLPMSSRSLLGNLARLPAMQNIARRVLEVLDADEEAADAIDEPAPRAAGVALELRGVAVHRGGRPVLEGIDVSIAHGERVAIVGASGSGKSSFLGTLLGWHVATGTTLVDGRHATPPRVHALRRETALVDPETYLWNRTLFEDLRYGASDSAGPGTSGGEASVHGALVDSELLGDLERMPDGLATRVGENGSRLSGGETQRLRIAQTLMRRRVRLVLLDEPFAGMDGEQRIRVRDRVLARWPQATVLWVSHHVRETVDFPRVLVFEAGRIVEDGGPQDLLATDSRYAALVRAETILTERLRAPPWRAFRLPRHERGPERVPEPASIRVGA